MLYSPLAKDLPAALPMATLPVPLVVSINELSPIATFPSPVTFLPAR